MSKYVAFKSGNHFATLSYEDLYFDNNHCIRIMFMSNLSSPDSIICETHTFDNLHINDADEMFDDFFNNHILVPLKEIECVISSDDFTICGRRTDLSPIAKCIIELFDNNI